MATRLTDSELATRTREANRRRGERYRERQIQGGKAPLTVWLPDALRAALVQSATERGATIIDTAELWLTTAAAILASPQPPGQGKPAPVPALPTAGNLFDEAPPAPEPGLAAVPVLNREERDRLIVELHRQGVNNYEIARRFNTSEGSIRRALKRVQGAVSA